MRPATRLVLLIEDEPSFAGNFAKALELEAEKAGDFTVDVHETCSVSQYQEIIKSKHFDVMVVDIWLSSPEDGLDNIILFHHVHSPDTVIIVYSSSDMDKVKCVQAMKPGGD